MGESQRISQSPSGYSAEFWSAHVRKLPHTGERTAGKKQAEY